MTRSTLLALRSAAGLPPTSDVTSCTTAPIDLSGRPRRRAACRTLTWLVVTSTTALAVTAPAVAATWPGDPSAAATTSAGPRSPVGPRPTPTARDNLPWASPSIPTDIKPSRGSWPLTPAPSVVHDFEAPAARWASGHRGVDLAGRPGQQVRAAVAGTVTFAGRIAGRGVIVVSHGATRTTYEPVAASVSVGDQVTRGGGIGTLELLGSHCLPRACLHWGLLDGETYLDPLRLLGLAPVRLLPWSEAVP